MPLNLTINLPCNDIGFPINKGKKPPELKIDYSKIAIRYEKIGVAVLKPIIDRIVFGFSPTDTFLKKYDPAQDLQEYKQYIKGSLLHDAHADDKDTGLVPVKNVPFKKAPYKNYNVNLRYKPPSSAESVFIQIDPKNPDSKQAFIRLDMNPNRFSKKAMKEFQEFIEDKLLIVTGASIPYADFLAHSIIYRADIAVDILGARPSELEIIPMANNKPAQHKSHTYKSPTGRIETIYPKAKKGKSSSEYIYDKRKELLDTGKEPMYGDFLHSRYECRAQNTTFAKLGGLKNRCVRISVRALDLQKSIKISYVQRLFIHYALNRTLAKALELLPPKQQPKFKKSYSDAMHSIWDAQKIWSFWKNTVKKSGLYPAGN